VVSVTKEPLSMMLAAFRVTEEAETVIWACVKCTCDATQNATIRQRVVFIA
jgi:hypothetical protein